MNILLLATHLNRGGITSYMFSLAKGLQEKGHLVLIASSGGDSVDKLIRENIAHIKIPINTKSELSPKVLFSFRRLLKIIREYKIEIVHAQTRVTQVLSFLLSKFSGVVFIATAHGFFKPRLARKIFPCWGKIVIAISQGVERHLADDFNISKERIKLIYNGIDVDSFSAVDESKKDEYKKKLGIDSNKLVIGIIARLSIVKGHSFLFYALKEILPLLSNALLFVAGEGREKNNLADLARRLNIEGHIMFYPTVENTKDVLGAMDIFCMPSLKEGLGLAILEAQACGIPVIGSCVGGIKEIIVDGESGILVPPCDSNALKEAVIRLKNNPELRKKIINNALTQIRDKFSLKKMIDKTEGVYFDALS